MERVTNFSQQAKGEFQVEVVKGTHHCGVDDRRGQFKYEVTVLFHANPLNEYGFLLDNTDFQHYFQNLGPVDISCELLAERSANDFLNLLKGREHLVKSLQVKIYPFGEVYVGAEVVLTDTASKPISYPWSPGKG